MAVILAFLALLLLLPVSAEAATNTGWVNIKSPTFGATGNGSTDDTAAIQAAIDYAFANNLEGVYCPKGSYKTTSTIYLDPPGNLRSSLTTPTNFAFSMSFFGDPAAGGDYQSCRIYPTFNNGIAFLVGTGQGMRVSDIQISGPGGGYRGQQSAAGVGIGLSGGSGGSSINLIENTYVTNFYTLYETDANGGCCLSDSNTFRKIAGYNGQYGLRILGTQSDINDLVEPRFQNINTGIADAVSRQVHVYGGEISGASDKSATFTISSVSAFTVTANGNAGLYTFTATISSPDAYINTVYNSYTIVTAHFGVIPLTMTNWNSGTHVATFQLWPGWVFGGWGGSPNGIGNIATGTDIQAEVAAVTTLNATERAIVADGVGISMRGVHTENPNTCTSLYIAEAGSSGATTNEIMDPYFNYDASLKNFGPGTTSPAFYCQQTFPFIGQELGGTTSNFILSGGDYSGQGVLVGAPLIVEAVTSADVSIAGSKLGGGFWMNQRLADNSSYAYAQINTVFGGFATVPRGFGKWDTNYYTNPAFAQTVIIAGEMTSPYCGFEPCPWVTPQLSPSYYTLVSGTLGALGSYPPIACRTYFKSVDWNSGALSHLFLRSASCPGYSWGQNLTDATVGETVTWSYKGQSDVLYLNAKTLKLMFPGLTIGIPDPSSGTDTYTVTGVYPDLGYVTVFNALSSYVLLAGTKTSVYSCSSSCTISQAAYAWTAY